MPSPLLRLTHLKSSKLSDQAMESILDQIKRGILRPGDRLPSLRELVSQLGVSQTAVREALRGLVGLGVIDLQAGRGAFVQSVSSEILLKTGVSIFSSPTRNSAARHRSPKSP